jgi:hypothetical protein
VCTCKDPQNPEKAKRAALEEEGRTKTEKFLPKPERVEKVSQNVEELLEECPNDVLIPAEVLLQLLKIQSSKSITFV